MIMTRGDAFPFESTAEVQPDGTYEFRNVPAGDYQFFAGWTGWGYEIAGDVEDGVQIKWPDPQEEPSVAPAIASFKASDHAIEFNEVMTIFGLEELRRALRVYGDTYHRGFPSSLHALGPPPEWYRATADRAGLIDEAKAGLLGNDGLHFSGNDYQVTYSPGPADDSGKIVTYTLSARPVESGKTGERSFFLDEGGSIYETRADRPATPQDPVSKN